MTTPSGRPIRGGRADDPGGLPLIVVQPGAVYGVGTRARLATRCGATCVVACRRCGWDGVLLGARRGHGARAHPGYATRDAGRATSRRTSAHAGAGARIAYDITGIRPRACRTATLMRTQANAGDPRTPAVLAEPAPEWTSEYTRIAAGVTYLGSMDGRRDLGLSRVARGRLPRGPPEELRRLQSR